MRSTVPKSDRKARRNRWIATVLYPLIALGAAIAIWAIVAAAIGVDLIVPSVGATMRALGKLLAQGSFYAAVGGTILRSAAAYAICFVAAICTAAAAARCKPIARLQIGRAHV